VQPAGGATAGALDTSLLEETLEQPDRGVRTHSRSTTFKLMLKHICADSRQRDDLSVPFAFMALLHIANLKSLRFVPMKDVVFGSDFKVFIDKTEGEQ